MKSELLVFRIENRPADHVGRQHVAGELYALVIKSQQFRERVRQGGFADARNVLDQQVPARQEATDGQPDLPMFAQQDLIGGIQ
jgi:predicted Rdx family selenoprotein